MKRTEILGIVLSAIISCPVLADPFWVHSGKTDMETEGWTYKKYTNPTAANLAGPVGPAETEVASEDAWKFVDHTTNYRPQYESPRMTTEQIAGFGNGWELKVRLNVPVASIANNTHRAGFQFIEPGDLSTAKIYRINFGTNASSEPTPVAYNLSTPNQVATGTPFAAGFHTYRLVGAPTGVNLFVDNSATPVITNIPGFVKSTLATGLGLSAGDSFATIGSNDSGNTSTIYVSHVSFTLAAAPVALAGDFNGSGTVDAADYAVWRKSFGTSNTLSGNGDETGGSAGTVDDADYQYWRARFGNPVGTGAGLGAFAVPEPVFAPLFVGMIALMGALRPNRLR